MSIIESKEYRGLYKGLMPVAIILFILGLSTDANLSLGCYQAGYVTLGFSILLILLVLISNLSSENQEFSFKLLGSVLTNTMPFFLMLALLCFLLYYSIKYQDKISRGAVSDGYYTFSNISIVLLFIQMYIIYTNVASKEFEETHKISQTNSSIIFLLCVLISFCVNIIHIILKYYTTDGFQNSSVLKV
jgi:hypothetical protein